MNNQSKFKMLLLGGYLFSFISIIYGIFINEIYSFMGACLLFPTLIATKTYIKYYGKNSNSVNSAQEKKE